MRQRQLLSRPHAAVPAHLGLRKGKRFEKMASYICKEVAVLMLCDNNNDDADAVIEALSVPGEREPLGRAALFCPEQNFLKFGQS